MTDDEFDRRIETALEDEEIRAHPVLVDALENPDKEGVNPLLVDATINRFDEPRGYFDERRVSFEHTSVPAYHGAGWDTNKLIFAIESLAAVVIDHERQLKSILAIDHEHLIVLCGPTHPRPYKPSFRGLSISPNAGWSSIITYHRQDALSLPTNI